MSVLESVAERVSRSFIGYLHLWTWVDQKLTHTISGRPLRVFKSVDEFWKAIFAEELVNGARVRFKEAFITEWLPRQPGMPWIEPDRRPYGPGKFADIRRGVLNFAQESGVDGNSLGSVRFSFGEDAENYTALSLTTVDAWCCDLGVPLVVSSSVYDAFVSRRTKRNAVEADLEAIVFLGSPSLLDPGFLNATENTIDPEFLKAMMKTQGIPYVYLKVISPLDVSFRSHNGHPPTFLWSVVRTVRDKQVTHIAQGNSKVDIVITPCDPYVHYTLLTRPVDPTDVDDVNDCAALFRSGRAFSVPGETPEHDRKIGILSNEVVTEFDARSNYFAGAVPLARAIWTDPKTIPTINRTLGELEKTITEQGKKKR